MYGTRFSSLYTTFISRKGLRRAEVLDRLRYYQYVYAMLAKNGRFPSLNKTVNGISFKYLLKSYFILMFFIFFLTFCTFILVFF